MKMFKSLYFWLLILLIPMAAYGLTKLSGMAIENSTWTGGTITGANINSTSIGAATPSTGRFTSLTYQNVVVTNGICITGGTAGSTCTTTINEPVGDVNYIPTCVGVNGGGGSVPVIVGITNKVSGSFGLVMLQPVTATAGSTFAEIDCLIEGN